MLLGDAVDETGAEVGPVIVAVGLLAGTVVPGAVVPGTHCE